MPINELLSIKYPSEGSASTPTSFFINAAWELKRMSPIGKPLRSWIFSIWNSFSVLKFAYATDFYFTSYHRCICLSTMFVETKGSLMRCLILVELIDVSIKFRVGIRHRGQMLFRNCGSGDLDFHSSSQGSYLSRRNICGFEIAPCNGDIIYIYN